MSWDIYAQNIPPEAKSVDDIPSTFVPGMIGDRSDIIAKIQKVAPFADFSNPAWGTIDGDDFSIEVNLGEDDTVECVAFHIRGEKTAAAAISDILTALNLRAFDTGSGEFFDHQNASLGMDSWRKYRDQIIGHEQIGEQAASNLDEEVTAIPPSEMFYQGEVAWFRQVDLKDLGEVASLIPIESDLEILGFEFLGDFTASYLGSGVMRAWVNRKEHTYVTLVVGYTKAPPSKLGVIGIFYNTVFTDEVSLTTTTVRTLKDLQTEHRYRKVCTWSSAYNLFQEHKAFTEQLSTKHGPTIPSGESLLSIVQLIDKTSVQSA